MRVHEIVLQHFRNIASARLELRGRQQAFVGANGQGKTNLLEAAGFITALRSFRLAEPSVLIAQGQPEAGIAVRVDHERQGTTRVAIKLRARGKEVWVDETRVSRLTEFLGQFPTVTFSSQDQQLIRGAPAGRRRWLDLTLAGVRREYLTAVQTYHRALAERNALLKRGATDREIAAFERPLAEHGAGLVRMRRAGLEQLANQLTAAYARISDAAEPVGFIYSPDSAAEAPEELLAKLESSRARDRLLRATSAGPHRDDFEFRLGPRLAREFASEGQQRTLVLALRLAQADYVRTGTGLQPVLLADDVLGELDPVRRRRFWNALPEDAQVLATGTSLPDTALGNWQVFQVQAGRFVETKEGT